MVTLLADGQGALLAVAGDLHAENERHVALVLHLESARQFLLQDLEQLTALSEWT